MSRKKSTPNIKARTETFICLTQKYKNDKNSLQEVFDTLEKSRKLKNNQMLVYFCH